MFRSSDTFSPFALSTIPLSIFGCIEAICILSSGSSILVVGIRWPNDCFDAVSAMPRSDLRDASGIIGSATGGATGCNEGTGVTAEGVVGGGVVIAAVG